MLVRDAFDFFVVGQFGSICFRKPSCHFGDSMVLLPFLTSHRSDCCDAGLGILAINIYFRKTSRKMIEVVLGVAFQRVIVAACTTDASPKECLSDTVRQVAFLDFIEFTHDGDQVSRLRLRDNVSFR